MSRNPNVELHLAAGAPQAEPRVQELDHRAFHIALVGDFSGRGASRAPGDAPTPEPRIRRVDRDDVDDAIAAFAPSVAVPLDEHTAPLVAHFRSLEDLHPDQLVRHLPVFEALRALKSQRRQPASPTSSSGGAPAPGGLLDAILADLPGTESPAPARASDDLGAFVDRAVRGHVVRPAAVDEAAQAAKIDAVMAALLRALLHHPDFQALEAAWRAVDFFVRRLETDGDLQVHLVDCTLATLRSVAAGERSALRDQLFAAPGGDRAPWSLIVVLHRIEGDDVDALVGLARLGAQSGAPVIIGSDVPGGTSRSWEDLRESPAAAYLCAAWPRLLLRMPYGSENETETGFAFEEFEGAAPSHDAFLWGSGATAVGLVIAQSVAAGETPATQGTIERLPLYVERVDGESIAVPCAERLVSDSRMTEVLALGFTPLISMRDGDVVRLPRIQSVATPPRRLAVPGMPSA